MDFIKSVINEWDPIELLAHAPEDEYHSEIEEIAEILCLTNSTTELANTIYQVFMRSFGEGVFTSNIDECKLVAQKLLSKK